MGRTVLVRHQQLLQLRLTNTLPQLVQLMQLVAPLGHPQPQLTARVMRGKRRPPHEVRQHYRRTPPHGHLHGHDHDACTGAVVSFCSGAW